MTKKYVNAVISQEQGDGSLPVLDGTLGPSAVDIQTLYARHGLLAFDPGFRSTASCKSAITFVDGDKGMLLYRGYPIEELAEHSDFIEVAYLLTQGELPTESRRRQFDEAIGTHNILHEQVLSFYRGFRRDAHPMAVMVGVVGALSAFYHDVMNIRDANDRQLAAIRLVAKMPMIAAASYTYSIGRPQRYPNNRLDYASNLLQMMFGAPSGEYVVDPVLARALDVILILHADHEQNASTSTVRLAGASGGQPFSCIAARVASPWGAARGGCLSRGRGRKRLWRGAWPPAARWRWRRFVRDPHAGSESRPAPAPAPGPRHIRGSAHRTSSATGSRRNRACCWDSAAAGRQNRCSWRRRSSASCR